MKGRVLLSEIKVAYTDYLPVYNVSKELTEKNVRAENSFKLGRELKT